MKQFILSYLNEKVNYWIPDLFQIHNIYNIVQVFIILYPKIKHQ